VLTEIRVPLRPGAGSSYLKVERRAGDWPIASAAAVVWLEGDSIAEVGLGLAAVGAAHSVVPGTEDAVRGRAADEETIALAGQMASEECAPTTDQRGPADYKRALAGELLQRALRSAIARCRGQEG
jgi:carbon-monoxide dehydrogenase medium subunit